MMGWCCCCGGGGVAVRLETRGSGRGFGPKTRNRAVVARFRARHVKRQRGMMRRGGGMVLLLLWWWCGRLVGNTRLREGVWAKNAKLSCRSSVSGTPCKTAVGDGGEGWWNGVLLLLLVVRPSGQKRKVRGRVGPKTPKPSAAAQFWVCRVKRQWRTTGGGGRVMWTRWWW